MKNSNGLGNADEREHKGARIMPWCHCLINLETTLLNRVLKKIRNASIGSPTTGHCQSFQLRPRSSQMLSQNEGKSCSNMLVHCLAPHDGRIRSTRCKLGYAGVNFWTHGCEQKYSVSFFSSAMTPSHMRSAHKAQISPIGDRH